jgi:hypothetical protein
MILTLTECKSYLRTSDSDGLVPGHRGLGGSKSWWAGTDLVTYALVPWSPAQIYHTKLIDLSAHLC